MTKKIKKLLFYPFYACTLLAVGIWLNPSNTQWAALAVVPILYAIFEVSEFASDTKVKIAQAIGYFGAIISLLFYFNWTMLVVGLICGWIMFGMGLSVCLHKLSAHRTYVPKNKLCKWIILWFGTIITLGSTIGWSASHRDHHKHTDKENDPHSPAGNWWHKIKVYFYYFPTYHISPLLVKDLTIDADHKWFHRNYYKIIYSYVLLLWLINPYYAAYFYFVPVLYSFITTSWVTVVAHIPLSKHWFFRKGTYRIYNSDDYTYNSHVWQFLTWGEGYHNTHHACPWLWNNAIIDKEFDISAQIIKVMGIPRNIPPKPIVSVRRGKDMFDEIAMVQKEIGNR